MFVGVIITVMMMMIVVIIFVVAHDDDDEGGQCFAVDCCLLFRVSDKKEFLKKSGDNDGQ